MEPIEPPAEPPGTPPYRPAVNTLATLSLVFAFVFAPAGAVLGHSGWRGSGAPANSAATAPWSG